MIKYRLMRNIDGLDGAEYYIEKLEKGSWVKLTGYSRATDLFDEEDIVNEAITFIKRNIKHTEQVAHFNQFGNRINSADSQVASIIDKMVSLAYGRYHYQNTK